MLTLYSAPLSPNGQKIAILLQELGASHKIVKVDVTGETEKPTQLLDINPLGSIPALYDSQTGTGVFESGAILLFLAEKFGTLLPVNAVSRSEAQQWLFFEAANLGATASAWYNFKMVMPQEDGLAQAEKRLVQLCNVLNKKLSQRDYLAGEFSIADIAVFPWYGFMKGFVGINMDSYPALKKWADSVGSRPSVLAGIDANSQAAA